MRMRASIALAVALCWVASAAHAVSFTLDAIPGGPLVSGNGQLTISNVQFFSPFNSVNASEVTFEVLDDGVKLSGPVSVSGDALKNFFVLYEVSSAAGIDSASLLLDSVVDAEDYAFVLSTKQILGGRGQGSGSDNDTGWPFDHPMDLDSLDRRTLAFLKTADWEVFDDDDFVGPNGLGDDGAVRLVEAGFAPNQTIRVVDGITLDSLNGSATWISSTNRFTVVPEPGTAALTAVGLLLLAARRRSH